MRVRVAPPRTDFIHPATTREIRDLLRFFGPLTTYGVRSIELRHRADAQPHALLVARLQVPGVVVVYEQPSPPWTIPGRLSAGALDVLNTGGAVVELTPAGTRVDWPGTTLRDFVLFDGLMHEIGHHIVQHHTGKRTARVMRTADHERLAQAFAHACREAWTARDQQA